jgi:hypothetical protein
MTRRSEDELRAAFVAKADEAPRADDVLRAVRGAVYEQRRSRRRWLVPAVGAAVVVAGVGLGVGLTSGNGSHHQTADNARGEAGGGQVSGSGPLAASAPNPQQLPPSAGSAAAGAGVPSDLCRPADVTVTVQRDAAGATLRVSSHRLACRLNRVPQVQWTGNGPPYSSEQTDGKAIPVEPPGLLPAGATATATVHWTGSCGGPPGDVVRVDWGAGPVEVHPAGTPQPVCSTPQVAPPSVGAFTGLN